jgi:hypothetical protein
MPASPAINAILSRARTDPYGVVVSMFKVLRGGKIARPNGPVRLQWNSKVKRHSRGKGIAECCWRSAWTRYSTSSPCGTSS